MAPLFPARRCGKALWVVLYTGAGYAFAGNIAAAGRVPGPLLGPGAGPGAGPRCWARCWGRLRGVAVVALALWLRPFAPRRQ